MPRIFLADPSLVSYSGHCFEYLASLVPTFASRGYSALLVGNRAATLELIEQHGVIPAFTHSCDARIGTASRTRAVHEKAISAELHCACRENQVTSEDVFLINTLRHWPLRGVVDWLEGLAVVERPRVVIVMHFTAFPVPGYGNSAVQHYREAFHRIKTSPCGDRITLLADSEDLIDEYRELCPGLKCGLAPIPHAHPFRGVRDESKISSRLRVCYVGEARKNKGFDLLPYMIHRVLNSDVAAELDLHIHAFCKEPESEFYRQAMAQIQHPDVHLYYEEMPPAQYSEFVADADVLLMPYTQENYYAQTSGVFSEGIANAKITIVPKGTWMARQLEAYPGGVAFNPGDREDLSQAIFQVLREKQRLLVEARQSSERWCRFHNSECLADIVLGAPPQDSKSLNQVA